MEKLSKDRLNILIAFWEDGDRTGTNDEILACLLELKQLRAEKRNWVAEFIDKSEYEIVNGNVQKK